MRYFVTENTSLHGVNITAHDGGSVYLLADICRFDECAFPSRKLAVDHAKKMRKLFNRVSFKVADEDGLKRLMIKIALS